MISIRAEGTKAKRKVWIPDFGGQCENRVWGRVGPTGLKGVACGEAIRMGWRRVPMHSGRLIGIETELSRYLGWKLDTNDQVHVHLMSF